MWAPSWEQTAGGLVEWGRGEVDGSQGAGGSSPEPEHDRARIGAGQDDAGLLSRFAAAFRITGR